MTTRIVLNESAFNCRWIVPGSSHHASDWSYAICVRVRNIERLVNESDCSRCPRWEESDDLAERHAALAWSRLTSAEKARVP
jgi:hypothetical protein